MLRVSFNSRRQTGASLVEFVVALPALLLLGLGTMQGALAYHAKTTLSYATFEAARKGAVNHAQSGPMREELGIRLAPIFGGDGSPQKALQAITRASLDVRDPRYTRIDILNPTKQAFDDFGVDNTVQGVKEIPNSHLRHRPHDEVGATSGVNIQDANLLKIKITYGYKLRVPLINKVVSAVMLRVDPANARYYSLRRIPVTAVATVRMQSPAWPDNNWHAAGESGGSGVVPPRPPGDDVDPDNLASDPTDPGNDDQNDGNWDGEPGSPGDPSCGVQYCCVSEEEIQVKQNNSTLPAADTKNPADA